MSGRKVTMTRKKLRDRETETAKVENQITKAY